jgi:hypothetical protein
VGRRDGSKGLFLIFYEPWALTIPLDAFNHGSSNDPDRPRAMLKPVASRKDRAPLSCVRLVQCKSCLRKFFASYLDDMARNGTWPMNLNDCRLT